MERISKTCINLRQPGMRIALSDYRYDDTIFANYTPQTDKIMQVVFRELSLPDRTLLLRFAEHGSYTETAKQLKVSRNTIRYHIQRIRETIKQKVNA